MATPRKFGLEGPAPPVPARSFLRQDQDSHLSAAGHAGLLEFQRDAAITKAAESSQSAAKLRNVSFRLAARVAARDIKIKQQEKEIGEKSQVKDDLDSRARQLEASMENLHKQGFELLQVLSNDATSELPKEHGPIFLPDEIMLLCRSRAHAILEECKGYKDQLQVMRENANSYRKEIQQKGKEMNDIRAQANNAAEDLKKYYETESRLQFLLHESNIKVQSLEAMMASLQSSKAHMVSNEDKLRQELASSKDENDKLKEASLLAKGDSDKLKKAEERLKEEKTLRLQLISAEESHRLALDSKTKELAELHDSLSSREQELAELIEQKRQIAEETKHLNETLRIERAKTTTLMETESSLQKQVAEYKSVTEKLQSRITTLEVSLSEGKTKAERELEQSKSLMKEVEVVHKERIDAIVTSNQTLTKTLEEARVKISGLERELAETKQQAFEAQQTATNLAEELDLARNRSITTETNGKHDRDTQTEDFYSFNPSAPVNEELSAMKQQLEASHAKRSELEAAKLSLEKQVATLNNRMSELQKQIETSNAELAGLTSGLEMDFQNFQRQTESEISQYKDQLAKADETIRTKDQELAEMRNACDNFQKEVEELRKTVQQFKLDQEQHSRSLDSNSSVLGQLRTELENKDKTMKAQSDDLVAQKRRSVLLESQIAQNQNQYDEKVQKLEAENIKLLKLASDNSQASQHFHRKFRLLQHEDSLKRKRIQELEISLQSRDFEVSDLRQLNGELNQRVGSLRSRPSASRATSHTPYQNEAASRSNPSLSPPTSPISMTPSKRRLRHRSNTPDLNTAFRESTSAGSQGSRMSGTNTRVPSAYSNYNMFQTGPTGPKKEFEHIPNVDGSIDTFYEEPKKTKFKSIRKLFGRRGVIVG